MVPETAVAYYAKQQQIAALTAATVGRLWARMGPDFDQSWTVLRPQILDVVTAGQRATAAATIGYVPSVLGETGQGDGDPQGAVNTAAFTGTASDGRNLGTLYDQAPIQAKAAVGTGLEPELALAQAGRFLTLATLTQVADTRREVISADIGQRPKLQGYVRMLNPPSCYRCVILAGKFYRWNDGFLRHPRCFPAGVVVSGPQFEAATRRWYDGELVVLTTAGGQELPVTENHPVLTRRGWIPANLVREGDEVVRSTRAEGASALVVPDHDEMPARVEDVWAAFSVERFLSVESSTEDFHGDGQHGQVDVVGPYRTLHAGARAPLAQQVEQEALASALRLSLSFSGERAAQVLDLGDASHTCGPVSGGGLESPLFLGQTSVAGLASLAHVSARHSSLGQYPGDRAARDAVLLGESVLGSASAVGGDDLRGRQDAFAPRWDAPGDSFTLETREGYAAAGRDLLERLAGQVELDRVVKVSKRQWSGHVYSLTSSEGWHSANGLIVSNCDCVHIPVSENRAGDFQTDPYSYFKSLSATDQVSVFGKSEARAINDGAGIFRVANIRNRGLASAGSRQAIKYGTPTRVTVDQIYRTAGTRTHAIEMLQREGYITGSQNPLGNIVGQREGFGQLGKGGRAAAARDAVVQARQTGTRDPLNRYTMTAAERGLYDAKVRLDAAEKQGIWLQSIGQNSADRHNRPHPVTPQQLATLRRAYANELSKLSAAPAGVKRVAAALGIRI